MTNVAILWHMHQPYYEDLATREHILPWVRLHALKDYYGMVALMREFPTVKATFNLVPSLLVQLEAFAADKARDRHLELSLKPADALTDGDVDFILENFFHAQRQRMIDPYPRYAELLSRRGGSMPTGADRRAAARRFNTDDLRDLQVWQKLAWIDPSYLEGDPRVRALIQKGSQFTEHDKQALRAVELEILNRVIPEYRAAAERGQVEISTSPFYHPILPLLCDSDVYLRTHPDSRMPRQRFTHPEDAAAQLDRAAQYHERLFGRRPVGLWPSEGSVSDAMVPLARRAGFQWMATDELILGRTLGVTFSRDTAGQVEQPEKLYAPYTISAGGASIACAFRDHVLSDLIGFTYAGWNAAAAADDFVGRLATAGRRFRERSPEGEPFIPIILDGENAWEHFEGGGRPFLRALYERLAHHPELRTMTMAEGTAAAYARGRTLGGIFPGSWIDANFYIWIGHPDDQRGWSQLADARTALDAAEAGQTAPPEAVAQAREEIFIAEGSDWFWWYGDDHSSAHDLEFDDLFRRHLRHAYRLMQKPVPEELFVSNISGAAVPMAETAPTALVSPTLDGEETSYFEWLGAGALEIREVAGSMHQAEQRSLRLTLVRFGFDERHLYVRVDSRRPIADLLADGYTLWLTFLSPPGLRFGVRGSGGRPEGWFEIRARGGWQAEPGIPAADVAAATVLEVALPLAALGLGAGQPVAFFVGLMGPDGSTVESHPAFRPIQTDVPDALFAMRNWSA